MADYSGEIKDLHISQSNCVLEEQSVSANPSSDSDQIQQEPQIA